MVVHDHSPRSGIRPGIHAGLAVQGRLRGLHLLVEKLAAGIATCLEVYYFIDCRDGDSVRPDYGGYPRSL
ncbi:MAG: hypothetical protein WD851_02290 [Pirellulales bacterium]